MLTAILLAHDAPADGRLGRDAVARSLASLVEACVQGLVADAVLAGPPERGLASIADDAGCALVETARAADALRQALALARHQAIFLLTAGYAVERGFVDEIHDVLAYGPRDRALTLRAAPNSLLTRLAPRLARPVGLIAPKAALLREAANADLAALLRRQRGAELSARARRTY